MHLLADFPSGLSPLFLTLAIQAVSDIDWAWTH